MLYKNGPLGDNFKEDTTLFFNGFNKNYELMKYKARIEFGNYGYNVERINKDLMDEETFKINCLDTHTLNNYKLGYTQFKYFAPENFTQLFKCISLEYKVYKLEDNQYNEYTETIFNEFYKKYNWKKSLTEKLFQITNIQKYINCNFCKTGNESYLFFELENYRYCISLFYS